MKRKFNIGDKVAVLDDTIFGIIEAINGQDITIKTDDDFLMIYKVNDLVLTTDEQHTYAKYLDIKNEDLIEKEPPKPIKNNVHLPKRRKQPPMEVDLHIHQLVSSSKKMSNFDMLTLQINTAKSKLEFAIKKKIQRVVFIHGVGEGVLKKELEYLLAGYHVDIYPASFQKYGFGATEVYIYQKNN